MLPIYKAISFQGIIEKGGRTKPWVVLVDVNGTPVPYVVKLFKKEEIDEGEKVVNEVMGNAIAREFDLPVPKAALIEMDEYFVSSIFNYEALEILENRDKRIKFGCELLEGYYQYVPQSTEASQLREIIDVDTVFGFDNLIRNRDRGAMKPNLLINGECVYLIDHELAFQLNDKTIEEVLRLNWDDKFYLYHIFYKVLKNSIELKKKTYFETFDEYLKLLNVNALFPYLQQLESLGHPIVKHLIVVKYLKEIKNFRANFVRLLKGIIV